MLQYVPVGPLILAVLLFVLLPFEEAQAAGSAACAMEPLLINWTCTDFPPRLSDIRAAHSS